MISYGKIEKHIKTLKLLKSDPTKAGMCLGRGLEDSVRSGFNRWVCRRLLGKTWLGFQASSLDIPQVQCIRQFQGLKGHTVFHCISISYPYISLYIRTYHFYNSGWCLVSKRQQTMNLSFFCIFLLHQRLASLEICLSRWVSGRALGVGILWWTVRLVGPGLTGANGCFQK